MRAFLDEHFLLDDEVAQDLYHGTAAALPVFDFHSHLPAGQIAADLGELACGRAPGRRDDRERLFCLNLGLAVEDVVTARLAYERALARGVGLRLPR